MKKFSSLSFADILGVSSSTLCLIHCLVLPFVAISGSYLDDHSHDELFDIEMLDGVFAVLSLVAIIFAMKHSKRKSIRVSLVVNWVIFTVGMFAGLGVWQYLMHLGSLGLIVTHIINYRLCGKECEIHQH